MYTSFDSRARRSSVLLCSVLMCYSAVAASGDVEEIELRRLFEPTMAERADEAGGRIYIYDGVRDRDIRRAMDEEFERVDSMMFIRTRKTDTDGNIERDQQTGEVMVEDDGC
jgi:hypothetical protein